MSGKQRDWARHWLINRRADWLHRVHADPDLLPQEKVAAYAVSISIDEKTLDTRDRYPNESQVNHAAHVGMQPRAFRDAIAGLEAAGYVIIHDRGRLPNAYEAVVDPDEIVGRRTASHIERIERRSNARQNRAEALAQGRNVRRSNARQKPFKRQSEIRTHDDEMPF